MIADRGRGGAAALILGLAAALGGEARAASLAEETPSAETSEEDTRLRRSFGHRLSYGEKGLTWRAPDNLTDLWLGLRFQIRLDNFGGDLTSVDDLLEPRDTTLKLRRARVKGGGTLFADWLDVYGEYDFPSATLLDYRATLSAGKAAKVRMGQWKAEFNRERVDSSGKQQLAERSISNYWFTIDRQLGIGAGTRVGEGTSHDFVLLLEGLSGTGRGGGFNADSGLWLGRAQWNPAGEVLPFSQSDLKRRERPTPSIAVAAIGGRTPHTRFSSSGGGDLPGFEQGDYDLQQLLLETALHYRGVGWQQELHFKELKDRATGARTRLAGGYAQLGGFPGEWWQRIPDPLELVLRFAMVDPDRAQPGNRQLEWTFGLNWYFGGHRNKLTADYAWLDFDDPQQSASQQRFRLQWELSL